MPEFLLNILNKSDENLFLVVTKLTNKMRY